MTNPRHLPPLAVRSREMPPTPSSSHAQARRAGADARARAATFALPDRDMRAQAPARARRSCCALDTLRRGRARRLAAGARLRRRLRWRSSRRCASRPPSRDDWNLDRLAGRRPSDYVAVRLPGHRRCCSRARACTPSAPQRPGLTRIVASLFQVDARRARSSPSSAASSSRATTSSTARCSSRSPTSRRCAAPTSSVDGRCCCAPPATSAARCSSARGEHIEAVAPRAARRGARRRSRSSASSR